MGIIKSDINKAQEDLRNQTQASGNKLDKSLPEFRMEMRAQGEGQLRQLENAVSRVDNSIRDMRQQFKEL